ncbi:MAG: c-type cytochrome [Phormidesmis sp.]
MPSRQQFLSACLGVCLCLAGLFWLTWPSSALAQTVPSLIPSAVEPSEASFELNCAGCHARGGNIVRRGKNLKQKTLVRNGYGEVPAIAQIITQGKGAMPAYADRLTAEEIEAIARYVLQQAESGW